MIYEIKYIERVFCVYNLWAIIMSESFDRYNEDVIDNIMAI